MSPTRTTKAIRILTPLFLAIILVLNARPLRAAPLLPTFSFYEDGTGQLELPNGAIIPFPGMLTADPGPGGQSGALAFTAHPRAPFPVGDVLLLDVGGHVSDILRFDPATSGPSGLSQLIFFYSNDQDGQLADTGLPSLLYGNTVTLSESNVGPTIYNPVSGQPGFSSDTPLGVSYHIFSTPETGSTVLLFAMALAGLAVLRRRESSSLHS